MIPVLASSQYPVLKGWFLSPLPPACSDPWSLSRLWEPSLWPGMLFFGEEQ